MRLIAKEVPTRRTRSTDNVTWQYPPLPKFGREATRKAVLEAIAEQGGIVPAPELEWMRREACHKDVLVTPKRTP